MNIVNITPDGPLHIIGEIEILTPDSSDKIRETEVRLCRCGNSGEKPFCDDSHLHCDFRDPGHAGKEVVQTVTVESGVLQILPNPNGSLKLIGPCEIRTADGKITYIEKVSLCRCGASKVKPFCDATHKEIGFTT